ncbi:MAG: VOC family protein [Phycisphaerales bacterium]
MRRHRNQRQPVLRVLNAVSIAVLCDTQAQLDESWDKFVDAGGTPVACGWITDHFGVSRQFDPKALIEPDESKAPKATRAM